MKLIKLFSTRASSRSNLVRSGEITDVYFVNMGMVTRTKRRGVGRPSSCSVWMRYVTPCGRDLWFG